jgi:hypothetical protein
MGTGLEFNVTTYHSTKHINPSKTNRKPRKQKEM